MNKKEIIIAKENELQNGQMKKVSINDDKEVLLIRSDDKFYAIDAMCPHYGAPLETGILAGKRLMCPWHHALFDIETGAVCEPPALDGLSSYQVELSGDNVILLSEESEGRNEQKEPIRSKQKKDERRFIIIGGGAAGNAAAHQLRMSGYEGHLQIISADSQPPYDRTNLSKDFLQGDMDPDWLPLNEKDYFSQLQIELRLEKRVSNIDASKKQIELEDQKRVGYDKLLIASGGIPKKLNIPGNDLENVFTLRSVNDAEKILNQAEKSERITIIGASFIGMEAAENLNNGEREIHIIAPEEIPFGQLFGNDVGKMLKQKKENDGIQFHMGRSVSEFRGSGKLEEIRLDNKEIIASDLAILGIGVNPMTSFISNLKKADDNSLLADEYLQVDNNIYVAGDIATFPYQKSGELIRIEHWRVAEQQGIIAAQNMLGIKKKIEIIPFFWTNLAGMNLRYVGYSGNWNASIVHGDPTDENFIIYYIKDNQINAALGVGRDEQMAITELLMSGGKMPTADKLKSIELSEENLQVLQ